MTRQRIALGPPPAELALFPAWRLRRTRALYRAHRRDRGPWWFSGSMEGRFDLRTPQGTCYLALDPVTAFRERLGERLVALGHVPATDVDATSVSRLRLPADARLADTCHAHAPRFGLTREIATVVPYELPQRWAGALAASGFRGVRYETRFTTEARPNAVAVFGAAGVAPWPTDPAPSAGRTVAREAGIRVLHRPRSRSLRVIPPPR